MRKKSNYFEKRKIKTWIERLLNYRYASQNWSKENCENSIKSISRHVQGFSGKGALRKNEFIDKAENRLQEDSWRNMEGNAKYTGALLKVHK